MTDKILGKLIEEDFGLIGRGKWYHSEKHDSLVYNAEEDTFYWNSEDIKGRAIDYLIHVRGMKKDEAQFFLRNSFGGFSENSENSVKSSPYEKLVELMWANGLNHREYWYKRCLKDDTIDRYKLGYYNEWSLIPIYENGDFVNFQMRKDEPEKKIYQWYKSGKVFLFNDGILPFTKTIYITEGLVDCILLNQEGFPSVSAIGVNTWQQNWFNRFYNIKEIYYFEDNDNAGRIGAKNVAKSLGLYRVKIISFPGTKEKYDTGDFFKDGGTKETLREHINNNSHYAFELDDPIRKNFRKELSWVR